MVTTIPTPMPSFGDLYGTNPAISSTGSGSNAVPIIMTVITIAAVALTIYYISENRQLKQLVKKIRD